MSAVRAAARAAIRDARRRLEPAPEDLADMARVAALVEATPGASAAVAAMADAELLRLLSPDREHAPAGPWPLETYPVPRPADAEAAALAAARARAAALPDPGGPPDPAAIAAVREAMTGLLAYRGHPWRDLPGETHHLLFAGLAPALARAAPGAAIADPRADDARGPEHLAWRERHPAAAAALDRLWDLRPDGAPFYALLREILDPALGPL